MFFSGGPITFLFQFSLATNAESKLYNSLFVYYTCYRHGACVAPLGEELGKAVRAVGELLPRGEPLARQRLGAVGAGEALPVVGRVTVGHAPAGDNLR